MENNIFTYQYSAPRNAEVENIRNKYLPKDVNKMSLLKSLDKRVQLAGTMEGLTVGIIGCLIFGIGMCFGLDVFSGADWLAVLFCSAGGIIMLPAYYVYKKIAEKTKAKLAPEILRLSEEIINE